MNQADDEARSDYLTIKDNLEQPHEGEGCPRCGFFGTDDETGNCRKCGW